MDYQFELSQILKRIDILESINAVRKCLTQYMSICDQLNDISALYLLEPLFTETAIWEGIGEKYQKSLGRYVGRTEILNMFNKYITDPSHFRMNAHFLASENISISETGLTAQGEWLMLQTSTFNKDLTSHLNSARLTVSFIKYQNIWKIDHFQTENIFSRPISHWHSSDELPVPKQS